MSNELYERTVQQIGEIAVQSARLEHAVAVLAIVLIGADPVAPVILGQNWESNRQACITLLRARMHAAGEHGEAATATECWQLIGDLASAKALMTDRAHVVHALWSPMGPGFPPQSAQWKRWGASRVVNWKSGQLERLRLDLQLAATELSYAADRVARAGSAAP